MINIIQSKAKMIKAFLAVVLLIVGFLSASAFSQKAFATTVFDNFNRPNGGLGSNWTTVNGSTAPKIVSNILKVGTNNTLNSAYWSANIFGSDQFAQVTLPNSSGSSYGPGLAVRLSSSKGYFLWYGNSPNTVSIWRMDSSTSWTQLNQSSTLTLSPATDVWKIQAVGSTISGYRNGTLVVQATDNTYTTGGPGVWLYYASNKITNWSGGDVIAPSTYSIGGTATGLSGTVTLQNNGGDDLNVPTNGLFTFSTQLTSGSAYNVTVKTNSTGQTCSVLTGSGTVTSANVTNVSVTCTTNANGSGSDNFNRADGSLGPNWTDMNDGGLLISSQVVAGANATGVSGDMRSAETYSSNQYSQIEVTATQLSNSQWVGPAVRTQNGGQNGYLSIYYWNNGNPQLVLFKRTAGIWTQLGNTYNCGPLTAGTQLKLMMVGSSLSFLVNGVERIAAYDNTFTGGQPGIMAYGNATADNWSGGSAGFEVHYLSTDTNGVESYDVISPYNGPGPQILRVLRPTNPASGVAHNFIYTLPVQARLASDYGDGLNTLQSLNAQNQYNLTIIEPTFGVEPWYADNPNDPNAQQEKFMTTELQSWVKANLGTTGTEQHWLIGFSKSGMGGMDLLLKHPDLFTLGGFWDWPADMSTYNQYAGSPNNYGTDANFQANYRLTNTFLDTYKTPFLNNNRIWIGGYNAFQTDMTDFDGFLNAEGIVHITESPTQMVHRWDSGWVQLALAALEQDSISQH